VLVRARTEDGTRFLRRRPGRQLEPISLDVGSELPEQRIIGAGIRGDDSVVFSAQLVTGEYAILTTDGTSVDLLALGSDPRLPGGPFGYMTLPFVIGDRIVIRGSRIEDSEDRTVLYTETGGFVSFFADGVERSIDDVTPGGRAVVEPLGEFTQFLSSPDGSLSLLTDYRDLGAARALAVNDRDNVLFITNITALGARRSSLSLAGPAPSARCPGAPATNTPAPTATPSSTQTPAPTATPTPVPTDGPTRTRTVEATRTAPLTQTPAPTATAVIASPTLANSPTFGDGCQVVSPRGTTAWPLLLPILAVLGRALRRRRTRARKSVRRLPAATAVAASRLCRGVSCLARHG
jgi:hypothetical protein